MPKQKFRSEDNLTTPADEEPDCSRRNAMKAIVRFSAYVAPATYVLLDSKSAFAKACSGLIPGKGGTPPGHGGTPPGQC